MAKVKITAVKQVWAGGRIAYEVDDGRVFSSDINELTRPALLTMMVWQQEEIDRLRAELDSR